MKCWGSFQVDSSMRTPPPHLHTGYSLSWNAQSKSSFKTWFTCLSPGRLHRPTPTPQPIKDPATLSLSPFNLLVLLVVAINLHCSPLNGTSSCPLWQTILLTKDGWTFSITHVLLQCDLANNPPIKRWNSSYSFESESCFVLWDCFSQWQSVAVSLFWAEPWIDLEAFTFLLLEVKHHRRAMTLRPPSHVEGLWKMGCYEKRDG